MKIVSFILLATLISCGSEKEQTSQSFTYTLSLNGCETGTHTFDNKLAMCKALMDSQVNNNCAFSLREEKYNNEGCESLTGLKF